MIVYDETFAIMITLAEPVLDSSFSISNGVAK